MVLVTELGRVSSANAAAHELFGYVPGTMVGLEVLQLMPERYRVEHVQHREAYVSSPSRRAMGEHLATPALKADGTEFNVRASLSAVPSPTGLMIICALRPVNEDN